MGLREELKARRQSQAALSVAAGATRPLATIVKPQLTQATFAKKNVAAGGILEDETVEVEDTRIERSADAYFHAERTREITESLALADATLVGGVPLEHAAFEDPDLAHSLVAEQIGAYERPKVRAKQKAFAWEMQWEHAFSRR
jgi:hypothetical protein